MDCTFVVSSDIRRSSAPPFSASGGLARILPPETDASVLPTHLLIAPEGSHRPPDRLYDSGQSPGSGLASGLEYLPQFQD